MRDELREASSESPLESVNTSFAPFIDRSLRRKREPPHPSYPIIHNASLAIRP